MTTTIETVFVLEPRGGAAQVAIYNQWTGTLTLLRGGLVAMRNAEYDQAHYTATGRYQGAAIAQVAERVANWGRIVAQQSVDMASLSTAEYGALMRGVFPAQETGQSRETKQTTPAEQGPAPEDRPVVWKRAHLRVGEALYYETRDYGRITHRVGGRAGRWFVVRFDMFENHSYRTPFVRSHKRALALLDKVCPQR